MKIDQTAIEFSIGDKIIIHDRKLKDHGKVGKIHHVEISFEETLYTVLLDIVKKDAETKPNLISKSILLFKCQMKEAPQTEQEIANDYANGKYMKRKSHV